MKPIYSFFILLLVLSCKSENTTASESLTGDIVVNRSIDNSGGKVFDSSTAVTIKFDFRGIEYKSTYSSEGKVLRRHIYNENDTIVDLLKGDQFARYINEEIVKVPDSMIPRYSASVNSVHYFSVLPYGLNDKAVHKTLLGEETINNKPYHKVKVTFSEEGGGEDFDDEFIYWIDTQTYKVDYLSYSYAEDDGKGLRFREAYNERIVNGIRFVDYNNYKPETNTVGLVNLGRLFENKQLKLLSKIELEAITVDLIDN